MKATSWDVLIIGSGFAGSLTALLLRRIGYTVAMIDKAKHPRFAVGESTTPVANIVLRDLSTRYNLPRVAPLAKWGSWQRAYPELGCGLKRGFSYFQHFPGKDYHPGPGSGTDHAHELLVAASSSNEHSDTHWLRADVDAFLCQEARAEGVNVAEETAIESLERHGSQWELTAKCQGQSLLCRARFLIDGSGEAAVLPRRLQIASDTKSLETQSRAIFSHFWKVKDWAPLAKDAGATVSDYPFPCDDAAQHHVLERGWVWVLRFSNGLTSVGIVPDERRWPLRPELLIEQEWDWWLEQYPSLQNLLSDVKFAGSPGRLIRTGRLQRQWQQAAGDNWALLPNTAGFIDPLHSTGIAHSLCGIERLVGVLERHWDKESLHAELANYSRTVIEEVRHIDRIVDGCFRSAGRFSLFSAFSMLYFAGATDYEQRRSADPSVRQALLGADHPEFAPLVRQWHAELKQLLRENPTPEDCDAFAQRLMDSLRPFDHVGLVRPAVRNMYHHTAAPEPVSIDRRYP